MLDNPLLMQPAVTENPDTLPGLSCSSQRSCCTNGGLVTQWLMSIAVHRLPVLLRTPELSVLNLYPQTDTRGFPLFTSVLPGINWERASIYSTISSRHFRSNPLFANILTIRSVVWATNCIVKYTINNYFDNMVGVNLSRRARAGCTKNLWPAARLLCSSSLKFSDCDFWITQRLKVVYQQMFTVQKWIKYLGERINCHSWVKRLQSFVLVGI
jgi:hypothetical protein